MLQSAAEFAVISLVRNSLISWHNNKTFEMKSSFLLKKTSSTDQDRKFVINIMHDENLTIS